MKNRFCLLLFINMALLANSQNIFTKYVDPFIGTGGHGHTYPGAVLPHGMVQLSPDTRLDGWDGCSGYHYDDNFIYGFTHTHLSGTGCSDFGDILLMPTNGIPSPNNKIYGSFFSHSSEKASPGYYSVILSNDSINAELTSTTRVGFHKYQFTNDKHASIILDLKHRDEVLLSSIKIINDHTVVGLRRSKAWAQNQFVFFAIEFSVPFIKKGIWENDAIVDNTISQIDSSKNLKAFFTFNTKMVMAKVAISGVSIDGALKNLETELPNWDFEKIKKNASDIWEKELHKIEVESNNVQQLRTFYTALYHTMIVPNINMDVDKKYRGRDNQIHTATNFTNYSVFSLWDTYRAAHPLYTIIDKQRTLDYIKTFLAQYKYGGRLPVWELGSCETDCMIGYHSVPVIVDAFMKGINNFDTKLAFEAMKKSANWNHFGLPALLNHGYLEQDDENESVSKTLEYAYDDWCIAQFAKKNNYTSDYTTYIKRAQAYKNLLDIQTGFMRPKKNGNWLTPFDAKNVDNNFTEANSWQYSFYTPQDFSGYMRMMGGKEKVENKLDSLFSTSSKTMGREQADITGLIGQYAHGNEPSHHIAYLYNFVGKANKTQEKIHQIINEMYHDKPDGLSGNEDCGQMSAWYVLSALGFYPVTPGTNQYVIGTPLFKKAVIHLENKKNFTIIANNISNDNFYIQSASLNNKAYLKSYLQHETIMNGGKLSFTMGNKAANFGNIDYPSTSITDEQVILNPIIDAKAMSFKETIEINMYSNQPNTNIFYTADGTVPTSFSEKFSSPIIISKSCVVKALAVNTKGEKSLITTASFIKRPNNFSVFQNTAYLHSYNGGGNEALIDGIRGDLNWRKGNWQGYQNNNVDAVIDLKKIKTITSIKTTFLQDVGAWIVMPKTVSYEISEDGKIFTEAFTRSNILQVEDEKTQIKTIISNLNARARFVKIKALQYGKLPAWHAGAGGDTIIFIDEIEIN